MRKSICNAVALFALVVGATTASYAADLGPPYKAPAPVTAPVPSYDWTGVYVGVNGGYAWGQNNPISLISGASNIVAFNTRGGLVGGTVGAQIQKGHAVVGAEIDLDWASITGTGATFVPIVLGVGPLPLIVTPSSKTDAISTVRVRGGLALNNWLFYTTAGIALVDQSSSGTIVNGVPCSAVISTCGGTRWAPGITGGAGVEYGLTPNWSVKAEYLYVWAATWGLEQNQLSLVRAGVNYRF